MLEYDWIPLAMIFERQDNYIFVIEAKQKYRGVFETQKSGNKTSSGEIDLNIRTRASPKVGQD